MKLRYSRVDSQDTETRQRIGNISSKSCFQNNNYPIPWLKSKGRTYKEREEKIQRIKSNLSQRYPPSQHCPIPSFFLTPWFSSSKINRDSNIATPKSNPTHPISYIEKQTNIYVKLSCIEILRQIWNQNIRKTKNFNRRKTGSFLQVSGAGAGGFNSGWRAFTTMLIFGRNSASYCTHNAATAASCII